MSHIVEHYWIIYFLGICPICMLKTRTTYIGLRLCQQFCCYSYKNDIFMKSIYSICQMSCKVKKTWHFVKIKTAAEDGAAKLNNAILPFLFIVLETILSGDIDTNKYIPWDSHKKWHCYINGFTVVSCFYEGWLVVASISIYNILFYWTFWIWI